MATRFINILAVAATFIVLLLLFVGDVAATSSGNNPRESEQCHQQVQQQQLNSCRQYLRESSQCPCQKPSGGWREEFLRCCEQLEQMDEQCRCDAVRMVVEKEQEQRQQGQIMYEEREMQEMLQTAESLPGLCRIEPRRCDVEAISF